MSKEIKVVHYINQFFGGIGGEEEGDFPLTLELGPVGPGKLLEEVLKERGRVVATLICGDNYFHEFEKETLEQALAHISNLKPDIVIAGPAFNAGRYGMACGALCQAAQNRLKLPAVTGMYPENPGVEIFSREVYIVPTVFSAAGMNDAIKRMAELACKLALAQPIGPSAKEGYISRGVRKNEMVPESAVDRAVAMLLAKVKREKYETELKIDRFDQVSPPPPIRDLASATVALVTEGGIVPLGNPDRIEMNRATKWRKYSLAGLDDLKADAFESAHGGYDARWVNGDPDRVVPLDALRILEKEGSIGKLLDYLYVTVGIGGALVTMKKFGEEIAAELKQQNVDGVLLVAT